MQEQIAQAVRIESSPVEGDPLQNALAVAHLRERDGETRNGRIYPKDSPYSYPEEFERERYRRTEALLETIRPGPFENPFLIEMLARELVSIQMLLDEPTTRTVLIGTVFVTPSDVPGDVLIEPDNAVLLVDASLVDHACQMLKAAVMSWKIVSPPGVMPVSMSSRIDDTREVIAQSPELVSRFAQALGRMIREGRPGSTTVGQPPPAYHPALSMLMAFQKRFTVAVALARMVALDMVLAKAAREEASPPVMPSEEWTLTAERIAARWVFDSAADLDRVDPTIALHGISLGLASYDLIERSLVGFHPPEIVPARARAQHVADFFSEHLVTRQMPREEPERHRDGLRGILATLDLLWQAATESGELGLRDLEISPRWQQHMMVRAGSGAGRGRDRADSMTGV